MNIKEEIPPRVFTVGADKSIHISDMAKIDLNPDEQVTFQTPSGAENDVVRKDWGFYAMGSLNVRLPNHNLTPALVVNEHNCYYVMLVENGSEEAFDKYLKDEKNYLVCWLTTKNLNTIKSYFMKEKS